MSQESDLQTLHAQAHAAYQQGRTTFVARLRTNPWSGVPTGQMGAWMDSIEAVESTGWVLAEWSTTTEAGGAYTAFPLFRRRDPRVAQPQDRV